MVEVCVKCKRDLDPNELASYFWKIEAYVCDGCMQKHGSDSQKKIMSKQREPLQ